MFKPGDRVRITRPDTTSGNCSRAQIGAVGIVAYIGEHLVGVDFKDRYFPGCHTLGHRLAQPTGYNVYPYMIERLEEHLTPFQKRVRFYIDKELNHG